MTAVAIVGSHTIDDDASMAAVRALVASLPEGDVVITGAAPPPGDVRDPRGVDETACAAATARGLACVVYAAEWQRHGPKARAIRNRSIADHADRLVCFWDGDSRMCSSLVAMCVALGKPVEIRGVE